MLKTKREDIKDNSMSHRKHLCDPSLEPSRRDGSNDRSQNVFMEKYE